MKNRFSVKVGGRSGQGINTLGEFLSKAIRDSGLVTFAYREYPSIIKGGYASYQIDVSSEPISASQKHTDILLCMTDQSFDKYVNTVAKNGVVIHSIKGLKINEEDRRYIKRNRIKITYIDAIGLAEKNDAPIIMANMVILGLFWKVINLDLSILEKIVLDYFSRKKGVDLKAEKRCLKAGYESDLVKDIKLNNFPQEKRRNWQSSLILTGNDAIALGAVSAGCRGYYAYPMTPATSILSKLGSTYMETGILVKQAESEITAVQMVLGSMYMGTRAFTATAGGGYDLMSESISFAGMAELPLVIVLAQRAGPATGVPTWTGASDLSIALHAGHGEFPRCVLSASDASDAYELIQNAFNIAETYQLPVTLLTEKQISESLFNIKRLSEPQKIERGLVRSAPKRYEITKNGISPRWVPKKNKRTYLTNSDEHDEEGISVEDAPQVEEMSEKRMRKIDRLKKSIPEPKYYGHEEPTLVFVGMGSTKNAVIDAMPLTKKRLGYLHYKYIYPLRYEKILELNNDNVEIVLIENNQDGAFSKLIKEEANFYIPNTFRKYDGRAFFVDDILEYIKS